MTDSSRVSSGTQPIFAIFEGGGAKGIAHVGAYAAADEMRFEFVGVAGASAGAIVASLIAVGFKPNDIFNPADPAENIFSSHGLSPTQALGETAWRQFKRLRGIWLRLWIPILILVMGAIAVKVVGWNVAARVLGILAFVLCVAGGLRMWLLWNNRGIFDPAHFGRHFNDVLRRRVVSVYREVGLPPESVPQEVRFRDIDPRVVPRFCRLKIVATDISGQQLRLFDHRTPDVSVAEAVAASIAIPGLFKPAAIPSFCDDSNEPVSLYYADGGLVSNLPVWCFSEEKAAAERRQPSNMAVPIIAFSLGEPTSITATTLMPGSWGYFRQVFESAIFGGQTVVQEFVPDLFSIKLPTRLGVLAFDATWDQARVAHEEAKGNAAAALRQQLILEPAEWRSILASACQDIQRAILSHIPLAITDLGLRAAVFEPNRPQKGADDLFVTAYRITRAYNMEYDADDRLTLDAECAGVPEAFEQRQTVFWAGATARSPVMTKYERALLRRSVKCAICIPIFSTVQAWELPSTSRNQPLAVVAFDTDEDIISHLNGVPLNLIIEPTSGISALLTERRGNTP